MAIACEKRRKVRIILIVSVAENYFKISDSLPHVIPFCPILVSSSVIIYQRCSMKGTSGKLRFLSGFDLTL